MLVNFLLDFIRLVMALRVELRLSIRKPGKGLLQVSDALLSGKYQYMSWGDLE